MWEHIELKQPDEYVKCGKLKGSRCQEEEKEELGKCKWTFKVMLCRHCLVFVCLLSAMKIAKQHGHAVTSLSLLFVVILLFQVFEVSAVTVQLLSFSVTWHNYHPVPLHIPPSLLIDLLLHWLAVSFHASHGCFWVWVANSRHGFPQIKDLRLFLFICCVYLFYNLHGC